MQVPVQQTVMQCQPYTQMVPQRQCAYKQVAYTVCRPVRETVMREHRYTVCTPVKRTVFKNVSYTVCRPVRETVMREHRYTVCRPVQETCYQNVTETCYRNVTETACREVCETICVPRTEVRQVTRDCGEWVTQRSLQAGQDDLRQRLLLPVPRHLGMPPGLVPQDGRGERLHARSTISRPSASRSPTRSASRSRTP